MSGALLAIALAIDAALGEPDAVWRRAPHPVVVMGRAVAWLDRRLNAGAAQRLRGAAAILLLAAAAAALGAAIEAVPVIGPALGVLGAAILLAQRSLIEHVRAVADGLDTDLAAGRAAVALIVGRDPETLDAPAVARAAIESGAENFSDGVVAPAFWFLVAGLPGILVYKTVNTADSMIGHRTPRHARFGWAAARLDDALNLAPARLSAALIVAAAAPGRAAMARAAAAAWRDARKHASPNAGWPEAAMAGALDYALAGPRVYAGRTTDDPFLHEAGRRDPGPDAIRTACRLLWRAWAALLGLALAYGAASAF